MPRLSTPVVVAVLDPDRVTVLVLCPLCGEPERHRVAVGPYRARCGGEFRVVVRPVGGDAA